MLKNTNTEIFTPESRKNFGIRIRLMALSHQVTCIWLTFTRNIKNPPASLRRTRVMVSLVQIKLVLQIHPGSLIFFEIFEIWAHLMSVLNLAIWIYPKLTSYSAYLNINLPNISKKMTILLLVFSFFMNLFISFSEIVFSFSHSNQRYVFQEDLIPEVYSSTFWRSRLHL